MYGRNLDMQNTWHPERDPSVTSPLWETWTKDGMIGRIVVNSETEVAQLDNKKDSEIKNDR